MCIGIFLACGVFLSPLLNYIFGMTKVRKEKNMMRALPSPPVQDQKGSLAEETETLLPKEEHVCTIRKRELAVETGLPDTDIDDFVFMV
jgi:hypothetical protein